VQVSELRANYAALVLRCTAKPGRLPYAFDWNNNWRDKAIMLTTDHGFLLE